MQTQPNIDAFISELTASPDPRRQLLGALIQKRTHADRMEEHLRARREEKQERIIAFLAQQNAELAAACGACHCWGNARCQVCHGAGSAGWRSPDRERFMVYIGPVLARLGLLVGNTPATGSQTPEEE